MNTVLLPRLLILLACIYASLLPAQVGVVVEYVATKSADDIPTDVQGIKLYATATQAAYVEDKNTETPTAPKVNVDERGEATIQMNWQYPVNDIILSDFTQNTLQQQTSVFQQTFLVTDELADFGWQVGTETKTIAGQVCQRATGQFRGRDFTVWFAPGLPFSAGPWKFFGLPGLVLEAHSDGNDYNWYCKSIRSMLPGEEQVFVVSLSGEPVSFEEYHKYSIKITRKVFDRWATVPGVTIEKLDFADMLERTPN